MLDFSRRGEGQRRHAAVRKIETAGSSGATPYLQEFVVDRDLKSFGVDPLWITSFDDISALLESIK